MRLSLPPLGTIDEDPDEYISFLEELEHAAELLLTGGVARERMALVIVDSLAERLLYQHAQSCFRASEAPVALLTDPFPAARRGKTLDDFRRRVRLALADDKYLPFVDPILDELDAEIFRVAHDYRGAGYHRGEHNLALTGPLARLYAQAVGRAFARSTIHSFSTLPPEVVRELERFHESDGDIDWSAPMYATKPMTEAITRPLDVGVVELQVELRSDNERRLAVVEETVERLRRDFNDEQIGSMIEASQHWAQHRGDEQLHRLSRQELGLANEAREAEKLDEALKQMILKNKHAQVERMEELKKETEIRVDLDTLQMLRRRTARLAEKKEVTSLLHAYREIDELLQLLETSLEWAERSWDQSVQYAIDEARGK
jgi:hypothetical protein